MRNGNRDQQTLPDQRDRVDKSGVDPSRCQKAVLQRFAGREWVRKNDKDLIYQPQIDCNRIGEDGKRLTKSEAR